MQVQQHQPLLQQLFISHLFIAGLTHSSVYSQFWVHWVNEILIALLPGLGFIVNCKSIPTVRYMVNIRLYCTISNSYGIS